MNPTRIPRSINPFSKVAQTMIFPEPKNPSQDINFTGFSTVSFLVVLMELTPAYVFFSRLLRSCIIFNKPSVNHPVADFWGQSTRR
jgi:hypothetical protein